MGFYIQDDFWEALEEQPTRVRNNVLGALTELYFTGACEQTLKGIEKALFTAFRDRVLIAKKRGEAGKASKRNQNSKQNAIKSESKRDQNTIKTSNKTKSKSDQNEIKTRSNLLKSEKEKEIKKKENIQRKKEIVAIIDFLNEKTGKAYATDPPSTATQRTVNARLDEGFTIDDCKRVVEIKTQQWKRDPQMEKYLRPETLFGSKFETYLNEKGGENAHSELDKYFEAIPHSGGMGRNQPPSTAGGGGAARNQKAGMVEAF